MTQTELETLVQTIRDAAECNLVDRYVQAKCRSRLSMIEDGEKLPGHETIRAWAKQAEEWMAGN